MGATLAVAHLLPDGLGSIAMGRRKGVPYSPFCGADSYADGCVSSRM